MSIHVEQFNENSEAWDSYVLSHPDGSVYHLWFFKMVVEKTYRHKSHYLVAKDESGTITGVLPLFYIPSFFLGKSLVSIPFCDYGGIVASDLESEKALLAKVIELKERLKADYFELRQTNQLHDIASDYPHLTSKIDIVTSKVRMKVALPDTSDALFASFPAKLKSQIRKPQKEGCTTKCGGVELIDDFYTVFVYNMRDLGSPVHSKKMIENTVTLYQAKSRLFVVYQGDTPIACSCVAGSGDTLVNPWASFDRRFQKVAPNMLLYWEMLQYAVNEKYNYFDFGRSTPDEGTYKFKSQWGAQPHQLYWYKVGVEKSEGAVTEGNKKGFINVWQKLPIRVTKIFGPILRRQLHL
jgi:FemAB-related protein (PEP-CTERM system-associated)